MNVDTFKFYLLSRKIMAEFSTSRPKIYNYLTDDDNENKKEKTQKCVP